MTRPTPRQRWSICNVMDTRCARRRRDRSLGRPVILLRVTSPSRQPFVVAAGADLLSYRLPVFSTDVRVAAIPAENRKDRRLPLENRTHCRFTNPSSCFRCGVFLNRREDGCTTRAIR